MDAIQTLTVAGLALFAGEGLRRAMPVLARLHLPAAVLGGLAVALGVLLLPKAGLTPPVFDSALKAPLLVAFFTTLGFGASLPLLRAGGRQVVLFLGLATALAAAQGLLGMGIAAALGLPPLFGVLTSTTTLAGGPATALAFAPAFEQAGVSGAEAIGIIAAMGGIVLGGLVGGPVAGAVLREQGYGLAGAAKATTFGAGQAAMVNSSANQSDLAASPSTPPLSSSQSPSPSSTPAPSSAPGATTQAAMQAILLVLAVMWAGTFVSAGFTAVGITLPAYVGAMLVAAVVRNVADSAGWPLPLPSIETFGSLALPLFMAMALMTLELGKLAGLATPLLLNLAAQTLLVVLVARWVVPRLMGRDYDAAVMAGGFTGFMLGTTANAMAVMRTVTDQYGPAPRAYLVAPIVGAFFIDFANAVIITAFLNFA
jgi:ESS family glutamate:Na+ symporter